MKTEEDDSSYYASPRQQQTPQVIAVYNYEAQGAQELELEEGEGVGGERDGVAEGRCVGLVRLRAKHTITRIETVCMLIPKPGSS